MSSGQDHTGDAVFSVHATKRDDTAVVEVLFWTEEEARAHAQARSRDPGVVAVGVARFVVGELGTRSAVGWYADGVEQPRTLTRRHYPDDG